MTVRVSTFETMPWDKESQDDQERAVGRFKVTGASLDLSDDSARLNDPPAFEADQANVVVPLDAHVRKANPRRSDEDKQRRLLRRGYPLIGARDGGMTRGLAFVSFARSTSTQFEFIVRAWLRNPDFPSPAAGDDRLLFHALQEQVLCGGYYFVPPIAHRRQPWSWVLPDGAVTPA
jgi:Dyp-type peroxidase family